MRSGVKHASVVTHRETQTETGFVDAGAGEGGMHQENRADKHTPCVTRTASGRPVGGHWTARGAQPAAL